MDLHLDLLMELSCILLMAPLMVTMMANLWVYCLDKMMDVRWALHMVLLMACLYDQHWECNLDLLTENNWI